jgi:phage/conjugal plasmid C-4 type zinc finger TraR family protein
MDVLDLVQERETAERDSLIARARTQHAGPILTSMECQDCGEEIPAARRKAIPGVKRCAFCQGQVEA